MCSFCEKSMSTSVNSSLQNGVCFYLSVITVIKILLRERERFNADRQTDRRGMLARYIETDI